MFNIKNKIIYFKKKNLIKSSTHDFQSKYVNSFCFVKTFYKVIYLKPLCKPLIATSNVKNPNQKMFKALHELLFRVWLNATYLYCIEFVITCFSQIILKRKIVSFILMVIRCLYNSIIKML